MYTSFGKFTRYYPEYDPEDYAGASPLFVQNEDGVDFYELRKSLYNSVGPIFISSKYDAFFTVADGIVSVVSKGPADPTRIFPQGQELFGYIGSETTLIEPGMRFDGSNFYPVVSLKTFPAISRKQLAMWVFEQGIINFVEALAWATVGTLPNILSEVLEGLPTEAFQSAMFHLSSSGTFERDHPLTSWVGFALSTEDRQFNDDVLDQVWLEAYQL